MHIFRASGPPEEIAMIHKSDVDSFSSGWSMERVIPNQEEERVIALALTPTTTKKDDSSD